MAKEEFRQQMMQEDFLTKQLDAENVSENIGLLLRGYRWDPIKKEVTNIIEKTVLDKKGQIVKIQIENKPILNEQGIHEITKEIRSRISNVNGSASLTNTEIKTSRLCLADNLWTTLRINRPKYDLKVEDLGPVLAMIDDAILLFLSRTKEGGLLKSFKSLFGRKENVNYNLTGDQKSMNPGIRGKNPMGGLFS